LIVGAIKSRAVLYDAHNHLQFEELTPHLDPIARDLTAINLGGAVVNGTHPTDWDDVVALAERFPWVTPSFGIHPWDVAVRPADWQLRFIHYLETHLNAHVGEIGLDRWILEPGRDKAPTARGRPPRPNRRAEGKSVPGNSVRPPTTTRPLPSTASALGGRCWTA